MTSFVPVPPALEQLRLVRELNHRIHNEFNSAINFISVDAMRADNPHVKGALCSVVELLQHYEEINRILSMPDRDTLIDGAEYLRKLAFTMGRSRLDRLNIHLLLSADTLPLQSDRCWRLGLAVHELVANSVQHACFDGREGKIRIELTRAAGGIVNCAVSDNGSQPAKVRSGRGLKIVRDLANSLGGRIEHVLGRECTSFAVSFPLTAGERQANRNVASRRNKLTRQPKSARPLSTSSVTVPPLSSPEPLRQLFAD